MAKERLTVKGLESEFKKAVEEAKTKSTRIKISDGNNIYLIVRPTGGASWVLNYKMEAGTAPKPLTLCDYGKSGNLKMAREMAEDARKKIARGIDPKAEKDETEEEIRLKEVSKDHTVKVLFEAWIKKHDGSDVYHSNIRAAFVKDILAEIGFMKPEDVKRTDVMKILRAIEDRDALVVVRRVRMWLRQMFEYGIDHENYVITLQPVPSGNLTSFKTRKGGHFAAITDPKLVPKLLHDIDGYSGTITRMYLQIAARLFVRPTELREASWGQFDMIDRIWVIPADSMKLGREFWVPLSDQAPMATQSAPLMATQTAPP